MRVVAGNLFALLCSLAIAAITAFGVINVGVGVVLLIGAGVVGTVLVCTELLPGEPPLHKVKWSLGLWVGVVTIGVIFWFLRGPQTQVAAGGPKIVAAHQSIGQQQAKSITNNFGASSASSGQQDTAIFMDCQIVPLPLTIKGGANLNLIALDEKVMVASDWGFVEVPGFAEGGKWPSKSALDRSRKMHNFGMFAYRCQVTNRGPQTIIYLEIPMDIWFGNEGGDKDKKHYAAIVSALGPNDTSVFYLVNNCDTTAVAIWQDTAIARILGEAKQRNVPLRRIYATPIDQIMVFVPTSIQWVGEACK